MNVVDRLAGLVERLYQESENYAQNPSDAQLWYNRGYANGIAAFLNAQNSADKIKHLNLDAEGLYKGEQVMEWHKAYHHGFEMGFRESGEVMPQAINGNYGHP
ncbi:MAG: hypothetical protein ACNYZG_05030 [Gammaproteobacteria bacterium]